MNSLKLIRRKKNYPIKRYYKRRNRLAISRTLKNSDTTSVKVEYYTNVHVDTAGNLTLGGVSIDYVNMVNVLNTSSSFTDLISRYGRYKINGIQLKFDSCLPVPNSNLPLLPQPNFAFYPAIIGTSLGAAPLYNDNKFATSCTVTTPQTKYIAFPNNYFTASAGGYGTWNNMNSYTSITGEICVSGATSIGAPSSAQIIGALRVTVYVTVSSKNA